MFERIAVGAPAWKWPAMGVAVALLLLVFWVYTRRPARGGIPSLAGLLKAVALVALTVCLLEPLYRGERPRPQANVVGLVVDTSQSMQIKSSNGDRLSEQLATTLKIDAPWRVRLEQDFDVRTYAFDSRLQSVEDFAGVDFSGSASSLNTALATAAARFQNRPVAGLILFTDGNATDALSNDASHGEHAKMGFPIYPVVSDFHDDEIQDVRIARITTSQTDFEAAPVTVNVQAVATGVGGQPMIARLMNEKGEELEQQSFTISNEEPEDIRFQFRPKESGTQFYRVDIYPKDKQAEYESGELVSDTTLTNNQRVIAVHRRAGPYRILYVSGRPNWEFKFLRRSLQEDDEIQLVGLVRIARKEPKFSFRDKAVTSTNPLFAGFDDDEDGQQYDEPVFVRLGVDEANELREGFPKTKEELYPFHAVVLDDIEAASFTTDQMLMLREFVSARGGGLMLLGGQESFAKGGYAQTPIGEMSPVYVGGRNVVHIDGPFRVQLTREGWLAPWMRLRSTEVAEQKRLAGMPTFATLNPIRGIKPGASVFATVETAERTDIPALVAQRFGKGRSAALLIGDMWRWAMRRKDGENQDLPQLWRQTMRWLVSDVPRQVDVQIIKPEDPTEPVQVAVTAHDEEFKSLDNAEVTLTLVGPDGKTVPLSVDPSDEKPGVYTASYWPNQSGGYRVTADVAFPDGTDLGKRTTGWTSDPAAVEFEHLQPNRKMLKRIANESGGEVILLDDLNHFVASLPDRKVPITEQWVYPLWHRPWVLLFALVCLCGEWGLRRWKGLP